MTSIQNAEIPEANRPGDAVADERHPAGMLGTLDPWQCAAAAVPALFGPLCFVALRLEQAPVWAYAAALGCVVPLVLVAGLGAARRMPAYAFALSALPFGLTAAWFASISGGPLSPAAPWMFVALGLAAMLGGRLGAALAAVSAVALGAAFFLLPTPEIRFFGFAPRPTREAMMITSWVFAGIALGATAWAAAGAWANALPPLRRGSIALRRSLEVLSQEGGLCGLRLSAEGGIIQVLGAAEAATGLPAEKLTETPLRGLIHPDDMAEIERLRGLAQGRQTPLRDAQTGETPTTSVRLRSPNGGYRWTEISLAPGALFPSPSGSRMQAGTILVMRTRRRAEEMTSQGTDPDRSAFLAHMSQELRGSLTRITGFTEIMKNEMFGPIGVDRYRDYARSAHDEGLQLLETIDELLDLSEIEAGRFAANRKPVALAPLIEGVIRAVKHRADQSGVAVTADVSPKNTLLETDRRALRRILINLLNEGLRNLQMGDSLRLNVSIEGELIKFAVSQKKAPDQPKRSNNAAASSNRRDPALGRMVTNTLVELLNGSVLIGDMLEGDGIVAEVIFAHEQSAALADAPGQDSSTKLPGEPQHSFNDQLVQSEAETAEPDLFEEKKPDDAAAVVSADEDAVEDASADAAKTAEDPLHKPLFDLSRPEGAKASSGRMLSRRGKSRDKDRSEAG
ncbi:MAG: hypothetical protein MRY63_05570 [Neomegalonema sp.]|nr:hypothetical protein [Neomegalonema sp.]